MPLTITKGVIHIHDKMGEGRVEGLMEGGEGGVVDGDMPLPLQLVTTFSQFPFETWLKCFCLCLKT